MMVNQIAIISTVASLLILILVAGEWVSGYGGLKTDVANLQSDVAELRQDVQELRTEVRQDIRDLRDEIRISQSEVIAAIESHRHDPETGETVFLKHPPQ